MTNEECSNSYPSDAPVGTKISKTSDTNDHTSPIGVGGTAKDVSSPAEEMTNVATTNNDDDVEPQLVDSQRSQPCKEMDVDANDANDGGDVCANDAEAVAGASGSSMNPADSMSVDEGEDTTNTATTSDDEDDEDDDDEGKEDKATPPTTNDPTDLIVQAITHKEEGNAYFKSGNLTSATRAYRKGTTLLKPLNKQNTGDDQVKTLLISLQTNLSMVCFKQNKHKMSRDVASKALEVDRSNVKALYRRGVAHRAMGDLDAARADLKEALRLDPNNAAVKKELLSLKKSVEEAKALEKERLKKAFQKSGSFLYQDRESEEKKKLKEKEERKLAEQKALEKRKQDWEEECVRRMAHGEEAISFQDWDKERKRKEEEEEKERKRARKEEENRKREERRKARAAAKGSKPKDEESSDEELTEKELSMLRGYKKTSDGRTTSYFHREQTEHEKALIGCIAPKRLDSNNIDIAPSLASESPSPSNTPTGPTSQMKNFASVGSAWNKSGTTWEEKDTTEWCKNCLKESLRNSTAAYASSGSNNSSTYVAAVKEVTDLTGDASVALAGGKKRYIYDFHALLKYEIVDEGDGVVASGSLNLPDINSAVTGDEELEVDVLGWEKAPRGEGLHAHVEECRNLLVGDVRKSVLRFVEKFNANF